MTMGRHGNRLHHHGTLCIPHGCSLSLRAELHPAEQRRGRGVEGERVSRRAEGRRRRDPEFRWISAALASRGRGANGPRGNGQSPLRIYV